MSSAELGLFKIGDGDSLIPTRLLQKEEVDSDSKENRWYGSEPAFAVGPKVTEIEKAEFERRERRRLGTSGLGEGEIFSSFKADLMSGMGGEANKMRLFRSSRDKGDNNIPLPGHLKEPRKVAEAFLGRLLLRVSGSLQRYEDFEEATFKVYFTQPAAGDRDISAKYRNTFYEHIMKGIGEGMRHLNEAVEFPEKEVRFMYEPYGAYHYVSKKLDLEEGDKEERRNFLVVDVGGVTTDIAIVQAKPGKTPTAYPTSASIEHAGNHFDRILLRYIRFDDGQGKLGEKRQEDLAEKRDVMQRIQRVKEAVSESGEPRSVSIGTREGIVDSEVLHKAFSEWWEKVKKTVSNLIERVQKRVEKKGGNLTERLAHFDQVFLVGGGAKVAKPNANLLRFQLAVEFEEVLDGRVVAPGEYEQHASTLPATGLALNVRSKHEKERLGKDGASADYDIEEFQEEDISLEARFMDDNGRRYRFGRKGVSSGLPSDDKVVLAKVGEFKSDDVNKTQTLSLPWDDFETQPLPDNGAPEEINLKVKTDLMNGWEDAGTANIDREKMSPTHSSLAYRMEAQNVEVGDSVLFYNHYHSYASFGGHDVSRPTENNTKELGHPERNEPIELKLSRQYETAPNDVAVCIDLGMTNTAVAVYAPGRDLPEEHFEILESLSDTGENGDIEGAENDVSGKGVTQNGEAEKEVSNGEDENADWTESESLDEKIAGSEASDEDVAKEKATADDKPGTEGEADAGRIVETLERIEKAVGGEEGMDDSVASRLESLEGSIDLVTLALDGESKDAHEADPRPGARKEAEERFESGAPVEYSEESGKLNSAYSFGKFREFVEEKGYHYEEQTLRVAWAQAMSPQSRLIVLAGPPGVGKTSLVSLLAEFFNPQPKTDQPLKTGERNPDRSSDQAEPFYEIVSVSPAWFSSSSLLGYYSEVDRCFHGTDFLNLWVRSEETYKQAERLRERSDEEHRYSHKFFACLDEFNLAHPEQYLSSVLSAMEQSYNGEGDITVAEAKHLGDRDEVKDLKLSFPPNLKLFATVNTDAASKQLSPKVLDRAVFERVVPTGDAIIAYANEKRAEVADDTDVLESFFDEFLHRRGKQDPELKHSKLLKALYELADKAQAPIGFRTFDAVRNHLLSHPYRFAAEGRGEGQDESKMEKGEVRRLIGEVICDFFLSKLPGAHNTTRGRKYHEVLDAHCGDPENASPEELAYYPGVAKVVRRLRDGRPGQAAF
jgi:MoxR-like ATPase